MPFQILRACIFLILLTGLVSAQVPYRPIEGGIPLQYGAYPASDLVSDGKILLPEEAHELYLANNKNTRGRWNLSELNPEENEIWKNILSLPFDSKDDDLPLKDELDQVSFVSYSITRLENYRFTVAKDHSFYLAYIGPKVHNFLLRKNLLRKLGYTVPAVKYLKSLKVEFNTVQERDDFILDFQTAVGRDVERWITSYPEGENYFYAQDLIIMEDQNTIPNLSIGYISEDIVDGKRIYQSLVVPYALTDMPESVNMFSWAHGRVLSENVLLPYENSENLSPSSDDAIWITKRILALTENDWVEIAENSHFPPPVAALLTEKLKSRRNHLASLFAIKSKKLNFDPHYTDPDGTVKDGKLMQEFFEGYGRRFKIPDPESPLSFSEMSSLFKAKAVNQGIELLVSAFNSANFMSNNVEDKIAALNNEISTKAGDLLKNGKPLKGLVDSYAYPMVAGKIILSRDVVAGSYLGTDNLIQLVDTVGFSVSGGLMAGLGGVFSKTGAYSLSLGGASWLPVNLSGSAQGAFTRSYAHVKPILSIKKALKYPFKNVFIPLIKRKDGKILGELAEKNFDKINKLAQQERDKEYEKIYQVITDQLEIGESIIITDSISVGIGADAGVGLYNVVNVRGKVGANSVVLSRLHILRKSQEVIQIYKDLGNSNGYEVTVGIDKLIPIIKLSQKGDAGGARTKFFNVRLSPGAKDFKGKLSALSSVFKTNSLSVLKKIQSPYVIGHSFKESNSGAGILVFRWNHLNSTDKITVTAPNGDKQSFMRRYKGHSIGRDYESFLQDLVSLFSAKIFKTQFSPTGFGQTNPGYTYQGKAFNKIQIYESEVSKDGKLLRPYTRLTRIWNGWQTKKKKAINILREINERYRFNFMPDVVLAQTKKLFLYNISVNLYVHKEGITSLVAQDEQKLMEIFKKYQSRDNTNYTGNDVLVSSGYKRIVRWQKKYKKYMAKDNVKKASSYLLKMVSIIERKLTSDGYIEIFGGKQNFLLMASIDGFRIGDENGDQAIKGSSIGMIGNENLSGPTADLLEFFRQTGSETMTEGEFYVNWLLGRII